MQGKTLGAYRVERELGSGGMGTVWLARDESGQSFAIKIVHSHLLESPGFRERFLREAEVGKAVRHTSVVRCYDVGALDVEGKHQNFLVMEYVEGQTLRQLLGELERVPEELCRHIGREVAKGLAAIHEAGVVHRDLKPENVLITPDHEIKIMDLGVARLADEAIRLSQSGAFVGSIHYAAPEQFKGGGENLDGRADLHALGLILYELSSGIHPYMADDLPLVLRRVLNEQPRRLGELNPQLSAFYEEVVHTLIAKDRERRFASSKELLRILMEGEESTWWRGRAQAIRAETKRPLRRIRIPRETAVYGREDELAILRASYMNAKAGEARVVLIEGETGVGKTRLVDELVLRLEEDGEDLNFLFGGYLPGGAATSAGAFSTAYREHFGEESLEESLTERLPRSSALVPAFAALLRGDPAPIGAEPLQVDSIHNAFRLVTRSLASERPTLLLADDLHFAPEEGLGLFASLAAALRDDPVLLIATWRPGISKQWLASMERNEGCRLLTLPRLGPRDLTGLLREAFRSERLAQELAFTIAETSDGNPFFVFEIIRGLREGGLLSRESDGSWVRTGEIKEICVPSSLLALIQSRISALAEEERELLEVAACLGFEFDVEVVAVALGKSRIPVMRSFARIEKEHRLVRAVGRRFLFDHHQVQWALYHGLPLVLREEYHSALGSALLASAVEHPEGAAAVDVCEQFLSSGRWEKARDHLDGAIDHLVEGHLNAPAVALVDRALDQEGLLAGRDRTRVLIRKAEILELTGRLSEQVELLEEAIRLADEADAPRLACRARQHLGNNLRMRGQTQSAIEAHEQAVELAREAGDKRQEAAVLGNMGTDYADLGRYEEARELFAESLGKSRETGDRRAEAGAIGNLALILWEMGCYEKSIDRFAECLRIFREIGYRRGEGMALGNIGLAYFQIGGYEDARRSYRQHLEISREIGYRRGEGLAMGNLGLLSQTLGRYDEAWRYYQRQAEITGEIGNPMHVAMCRQSLGHLLLLLGEPERARVEFEEALALIGEGQWIWGEATAHHLLGVQADFGGEAELAEQEYRRCLEIRERLEAREGIAVMRLALGTLFLRQERREEAQRELEMAGDIGRELALPEMTVLSSVHLALLPGGDVDAARETLRAQAGRIAPPTMMEARFTLWKAEGKPADLAEAYRLLRNLRAHAPEEHRESMITNVPLHGDIRAAWQEQEEMKE